MSDTQCELYLITPPRIDQVDTFLFTLEKALAAAPVACLQVRLKDCTKLHIETVTKQVLPIAHAHDTLVVVNDDPHMAKACGADGVHIGQDDMDYYSSRELLGEDAIIGVTCHNSRDLAFDAAMSGANYVAFGAFFETPTKTPKTRADLEILLWWQHAVEIPCVAIGGINVNTAAQVIEAGADYIAVSSGVWQHPDGPAQAVQQLYNLCQTHNRDHH